MKDVGPVLSPNFERGAWENGSGPDGVSAPLPGPDPASLEQTEERRLVPILPPAADVPRQTLTTTRMSRLDGCPECVTNTEPPREVKATADGWLAAYLCNDCGHAWLTSWKD